MRHSTAACRIALAGSLVLIALLTLTPVQVGSGGASELCILCGSRGLADFISNVILFVPFGAALACKNVSRRATVAVGLLLPLFIESVQFQLVAGRDASIGDVVSNAVGTIAGWSVVHSRQWWTATGNLSQRACALTVIALLLLLTGLLMFSPYLTGGAYYLQWNAAPGGTELYAGKVYAMRWGTISFEGPGEIEKPERIRRMLLDSALEVDLVAGPAPRGRAPIVGIYDGDQDQVLLLAQENMDIVLRYGIVADAIRLDHPSIRIPDALVGVAPGDSVRLALNAGPDRFCISAGSRDTCVRGPSVGDTWRLLSAQDHVRDRMFTSILWLWALFMPAGFFARRRYTLILACVGAIAVLAAAPPALGFSLTPPREIAAAVLGLISGWMGYRIALRGAHRTEAEAGHPVTQPPPLNQRRPAI